MSDYTGSTTAELLDFFSHYEEEMADVLVSRWAGLRSENQTQRKEIAKLQGQLDSLAKAALGAIDATDETRKIYGGTISFAAAVKLDNLKAVYGKVTGGAA